MPEEIIVNREYKLHQSMRLLLGIVAGLLISDMLKVTVKTIDAASSGGAGCPEVLTTIAAILFLVRLVVHNVQYYSGDDLKTRDPEKPALAIRVLLICLDLTAYGVCYHMVAELQPIAGTSFEFGTIATVVLDIALAELLQFLCCLIALTRLDLHDDRRANLELWRNLSALFGGVFLVLWLTAMIVAMSPSLFASIALMTSLISAVAYLWTHVNLLGKAVAAST